MKVKQRSIQQVIVLTLLTLVQHLNAQPLIQESRTLFHGGNRFFLEQDIKANTIPKEVWEKVFFGKTDFDLPDFRKGLYGAELLAGTSLYVTYKILEGIDPWVMAIKIKPQCLTDQALFSTGYYIGAAVKTNQFNSWYSKNSNSLSEITPKCLKNDSEVSSWETGPFYNLGQASESEQILSQTCAPVLNTFLMQMDLKVIKDDMNDNSWYIRDQSCIESIQGSPDDLFKDLLNNSFGSKENFPIENIFGDLASPGFYPSGSLYIVFRTLAETTLLNQSNLPALNNLLETLKISESEMLKAKTKVNFGSPDDSFILLAAGLSGAKKAIQQNQVKQFQKDLLDTLKALVVDHGKACHGHQGVSQKYLRSCSAMGQVYGKKLMSVFFKIRS